MTAKGGGTRCQLRHACTRMLAARPGEHSPDIRLGIPPQLQDGRAAHRAPRQAGRQEGMAVRALPHHSPSSLPTMLESSSRLSGPPASPVFGGARRSPVPASHDRFVLEVLLDCAYSAHAWTWQHGCALISIRQHSHCAHCLGEGLALRDARIASGFVCICVHAQEHAHVCAW